uniref:N(alpha)-acetyltransferase 20, NatB catalytic subunit n=1 Tax=Mus musculus TaxID=10090 RepID=E9PYH1_MOUSE
MTTLRAFTCDDLFRFNNITLRTGQSISSSLKHLAEN